MSGAIPGQIFREYDIRGVAERDLSSELARDIGRAFASEIGGGARKTIAVGRDCRLSSDRLFEALTSGLREIGCNVTEIGVGPTPMLYFAAHHLGTDGAVMITGSHNPGDENGFKMMRGKKSFFGKEIQELKQRIIDRAFAASSVGTGGSEKVDVQDAYVAAMQERFDFRHAGDFKFVVDAGNGSGGPLALRTMKALGLSPDPLFCEMDGHFPNHHPDPTVEKNVSALIDRVKTTGARVGIAYDGDADRIGAVDVDGEIIWGDKLLILFARDVLATNPGAAIIGEVKCSQTMYDDVAKHGGVPIMWKTGHSLIKTKMRESGALLAGEMSGHMFFADRFFGYDDAIYASLRLLEILLREGKTIGELLADVPKTFVTPELRVDCPDAIKLDVVKEVLKTYKNKGFDVADIDGARISFGTAEKPAWGLVRASNTGPILVMRFEATTAEQRDRLHAEVEAVVKDARKALGA